MTESEPQYLSRGNGDARPAAPIRIVHLGLGNFFRAHQAFYTAHAPDAAGWGIAAFSGRSARLARSLADQDGLFTLISRGEDTDSAEVIDSISRAHPAADHTAWLNYFADSAVAVVTLTITEAGYLRTVDGRLDLHHPDLIADLAALRKDLDAPVQTAPARLAAGLAARRAAGDHPIALVSCDNVPDNGAMLTTVLTDFANELDAELCEWISRHVSFVTTMVDRITPATTDSDAETAAVLTGRLDAAPVVTEPFREWVLSGDFPAGRPAWEAAGARIVDDIGPYERRKLRLLNGGHSLLAYAGSIRGHETIAQAVGDPVCSAWLADWWSLASPGLPFPAPEITAYQDALLERFGNPRIRHLLTQIAADGSQKLPIRVLPLLRSERAAGRLPSAGFRIVAAWILHLRGAGAPVKDTAADHLAALSDGPVNTAVPALLSFLDPTLGRDLEAVAATIGLCQELSAAIR